MDRLHGLNRVQLYPSPVGSQNWSNLQRNLQRNAQLLSQNAAKLLIVNYGICRRNATSIGTLSVLRVRYPRDALHVRRDRDLHACLPHLDVIQVKDQCTICA